MRNREWAIGMGLGIGDWGVKGVIWEDRILRTWRFTD
jgi:hypothetical protein